MQCHQLKKLTRFSKWISWLYLAVGQQSWRHRGRPVAFYHTTYLKKHSRTSSEGSKVVEGIQRSDKCNFSMIFIILLFIKIVSFPLFLLIWFNFYLYLSIHLCFEGMIRFQINLQGLYMQSGAKPIQSSQLTPSQAWIQEKTNPTQSKSNSD